MRLSGHLTDLQREKRGELGRGYSGFGLPGRRLQMFGGHAGSEEGNRPPLRIQHRESLDNQSIRFIFDGLGHFFPLFGCNIHTVASGSDLIQRRYR